MKPDGFHTNNKYSAGVSRTHSLFTLARRVILVCRFLVAGLMFSTVNTFASERSIEIKPYSNGLAYAEERYVSEMGEFKRGDGRVVKAYREELYTAMAMPTGSACWFVLPDGKGIRAHKLLATCLLHTTGNAADLYWFDSLLPMARKVQQFDGYVFVDVTTPGKRWLSIIIHLRAYLIQYLIAILVSAALASRVGKWIIAKPNPKKWRLSVKLGVGITVLLTAILFYLLLVIVLFRPETILLSACFSILTVGFVLYRRISSTSR